MVCYANEAITCCLKQWWSKGKRVLESYLLSGPLRVIVVGVAVERWVTRHDRSRSGLCCCGVVKE